MNRDAIPVLVAGGGGFIGGWLARDLIARDHRVRCADVKPLGEWYQLYAASENLVLDLMLDASLQEAGLGAAATGVVTARMAAS